ncbi:MAG TPA: Flp pilus assembly protein CpaB [Xanthobacteraceae bacterium]|nr:Flp pilus assembly protein CpaB [Xanthobacteraceae bacterium]
MRKSTLIMIAVAAVFGLMAVFVAQSWLNRQAEARLKSLEAQAQRKPVATQTLVVASRPLRFGNELTQTALREIPWPEGALPAGSFGTVQELLKGGRRVVLAAVEPNEPVLASKITGSGQRATLSALIGANMKAVTIRVNDVDGVAGFVLPGDRVDILMTRQLEKTTAMNDVVLQNARVLAIDQIADERTDKPSVVKAVTLEVDITGAQRLSLASQVGNLSLALRKAGESDAMSTRLVTLADLINTKQADASDVGTHATVSVIRASTKTVYSVPREGTSGRAVAAAIDSSQPQQ